MVQPLINENIIESRLVNLVKENGGSLSITLIKDNYQSKYLEPLPVIGKLKVWLELFRRISVQQDPNKRNCFMVCLEDTRMPPSRFHTLLRPNDVSSNAIEGSESLAFEPVSERSDESRGQDDANVEEHLVQMLGELKPVKVHHDVKSIINLLRDEWIDAVEKIGIEKITEFVLDIGRRPLCWADSKRHFLVDDETCNVTDDDIDWVLRDVGDFTDQNRAGISGTLHRISTNIDNSNRVNGVTIRLGRNVEGVTDIIRDLLVDTNHSILILGVPGTGKTTIIREVTKVLAETKNVWVVDTSNEIGGDSSIPHVCIGYARRMMVPSLAKQADKMIECVQNHTPEVIVIDEIGRRAEVEAAKTTKLRGVRLIASAHGSSIMDLRKNTQLNGLLGGFQAATLSDNVARMEEKKTGSFNKQKIQRIDDPVFEIVIELQREKHHEWNIIVDSASAVDSILNGKGYVVQTRMRDANTGRIFVEKRHQATLMSN